MLHTFYIFHINGNKWPLGVHKAAQQMCYYFTANPAQPCYISARSLLNIQS